MFPRINTVRAERSWAHLEHAVGRCALTPGLGCRAQLLRTRSELVPVLFLVFTTASGEPRVQV